MTSHCPTSEQITITAVDDDGAAHEFQAWTTDTPGLVVHRAVPGSVISLWRITHQGSGRYIGDHPHFMTACAIADDLGVVCDWTVDVGQLAPHGGAARQVVEEAGGRFACKADPQPAADTSLES